MQVTVDFHLSDCDGNQIAPGDIVVVKRGHVSSDSKPRGCPYSVRWYALFYWDVTRCRFDVSLIRPHEDDYKAATKCSYRSFLYDMELDKVRGFGENEFRLGGTVHPSLRNSDLHRVGHMSDEPFLGWLRARHSNPQGWRDAHADLEASVGPSLGAEIFVAQALEGISVQEAVRRINARVLDDLKFVGGRDADEGEVRAYVDSILQHPPAGDPVRAPERAGGAAGANPLQNFAFSAFDWPEEMLDLEAKGVTVGRPRKAQDNGDDPAIGRTVLVNPDMFPDPGLTAGHLAARPADPDNAGSAEVVDEATCQCRACLIARDERDRGSRFPAHQTRMIVCPKCGNKRCPHATDHRNACSGSNEPGQVGSFYGIMPGAQTENG